MPYSIANSFWNFCMAICAAFTTAREHYKALQLWCVDQQSPDAACTTFPLIKIPPARYSYQFQSITTSQYTEMLLATNIILHNKSAQSNNEIDQPVYSIQYTAKQFSSFLVLVYQVVVIYTVHGRLFWTELYGIVWRRSCSQGDIRIFLNSWRPCWMHPEPASEFIHTSSVLTGSSSSFLCQVQWAWVEFMIFSSPCPKLASLKTDQAGFGLRYLKPPGSN